MHKGFDVYFTDLEGNETFDFLIKRDMNEIEVECKTVSVDSGRKIHRHDFKELLKLIHEDLLKYVHDDNSNNVIFITAFGRLKIGSQEIKNIRRALQINFISSADIMNDHFHIMNLPYTPSSLPPNFESVRTDIRNEIGDSFFHCLVFGNNERCLLLVVRSSQEDKVLRYIKNGLRKASDQFSKTKSANLSLFIEDIYPDQWESLRAESGLHYMTATYLSPDSPDGLPV